MCSYCYYVLLCSSVDPNKKNVGLRILAGITTGGAAVLVAQPTDVVKVRMQAQNKANRRYNGCIGAYRKIAIEEGTRGLWKGRLSINILGRCLLSVYSNSSFILQEHCRISAATQ